MRSGLKFIDGHTQAQLLKQVGRTIREIPAFRPIDELVLQDSCGGKQTGPSDDFLVGRGLFYLGEQRRLFLDCTAGHYQMTWGYNHRGLCAATEAAARAGICWDNHSNIPQAPVKQLGHRLVELANAPGEKDPLAAVLLGVCTGSVACAAALKIQLKVFERDRGKKTTPVMITIAGSYHGSAMVPQFMRGMWPGLMRPFEVVTIEPNDAGALERAFRKHGGRVAGFWAEPILMHREAIAVTADYLRLAQYLCRRVGALMCIDEIQTGFWRPAVFEYRTLGCSWTNLTVEDYNSRCASASGSEVGKLVSEYRHAYDLASDLTQTDLNSTAAAELALRGMVADNRLAALTYQFLACGDDDRTRALPFVAVSRLMADGIGFGGEGDLVAAAATAFFNWLKTPASFSDIFTTDFAGDALFMSHMGEANVAMARHDRKVALVARPTPITRTRERQLALVTSFEPGPATFAALTQIAGGKWRIIAGAAAVEDYGPPLHGVAGAGGAACAGGRSGHLV